MTPLEAARAKRLDALHAVVSAACAVLYNDLVIPSVERDQLAAALDAEARAARAVTRATNREVL